MERDLSVAGKGASLDSLRATLSDSKSSRQDLSAAAKMFYQKYTDQAILLLKKENTMVRVNSKDIILVGDLHGNLDGLQRIFKAFPPEKHSYLFMGDYVDRRDTDIEMLALMLATKLAHPDTVTTLRGDHECPEYALSRRHHDFPQRIWYLLGGGLEEKICKELFTQMPVAAVLNDTYFVVHGGIPVNHISEKSPSLEKIETLQKTEDFKRDPNIEQLVWNDFTEDKGLHRSLRSKNDASPLRTVGIDKAEEFLSENGLGMVVRAHWHPNEREGYLNFANKVVTVISQEREPFVVRIEDAGMVQKTTVLKVNYSNESLDGSEIRPSQDPNATLFDNEPFTVVDTIYVDKKRS